MQGQRDPAGFILSDMVEDVTERLAFVRLQSETALVIGDWSGKLARELQGKGVKVTSAASDPSPESMELDEEQPYTASGFDFIASLSSLDCVNDLPGALIHIRNALAPGGLAIASLVGAGSLPQLRRIMLSADGDRPAGRMHPLVDVLAAAQLLQRAGWADPVVDNHTVTVAYRSLSRMVGDLRAQGLSNVLAHPAPNGGKAWLNAAHDAFAALADEDGRVVESFEILTLSGRRPIGPSGGPA